MAKIPNIENPVKCHYIWILNNFLLVRTKNFFLCDILYNGHSELGSYYFLIILIYEHKFPKALIFHLHLWNFAESCDCWCRYSFSELLINVTLKKSCLRSKRIAHRANSELIGVLRERLTSQYYISKCARTCSGIFL